MKLLMAFAGLMEFVLIVIMTEKHGQAAGLLMLLGYIFVGIDAITLEYIDKKNEEKKS